MTDQIDPTPDLRAALRQLAKSPAAPSNTRRVAAILDDIEASLAAGASRAEVRATLEANGFSIAQRAFESALYRARKQRETAIGKRMLSPPTPPAVQAVPPRPVPAGPPPDQPPRARNPSDLRRSREVEIDIKSLAGKPKPSTTPTDKG